ncbi:MAG TPA: winged helix-turn-helix domain-containing protein, partial [Polyangiales bacterium]|nr:winged helix-turn-helix domain-containing protein [Polyangiales bacterium]
MRNSFDQKAQRRMRSPNGRDTRWLGVAAALRDAIAAGRYATGEALPSTRELAREAGVHRHTVMLALDALVAEGLVRAEARRGYFVCALPPELAQPVRVAARATFPGFRLVRGQRPDAP